MADSVANLFLRIFSDKGDAASDVGEVAAALEALDHVKAEAEANVDVQEGQLDLFMAQLEEFDGKKYTAEADIKTDQLKLFQKELEGVVATDWRSRFMKSFDIGEFTQLPPHQQMQMDVDVDTGKAESELHAFQLELDFATRDRTVNIDVDKGRGLGNFSKIGGLITSAFGSLAEDAAGAKDALSSMGQGIGRVTVNLGMFGARLGPVVVLVLGLGAAIAISLVAALAALASSAALAAAALGALAIALAGALGPMLAIAIPAFLALSKVLKVLSTQQQDAATAAQRKARADQQAAQYAQQHADAERTLQQAVRARKDATVAAYREMQDAIERVADSYRDLEHAELSEQRAQLNIKLAKKALSDFRKEAGLTGDVLDKAFTKFTDVDFRGTATDLTKEIEAASGKNLSLDDQLKLQGLILDVKDAKLAEKDATDGVSDAERENARAKQDVAKFYKDGIKASDQYRAALERVADAQRSLARLKQGRQFELQNQAMENAKSKTAQLSSEERKLLEAIKKLYGAFKTAFGPAVTALLDGVISGLEGIDTAMIGLKGSLKTLGRAMGKSIGGFLKLLSSPEAGALFQALIDGATQLAPFIGSVFGSLFELLTKIAVAAMPFLVKMFGDFAGWLADIAKNTSLQDITDFIMQLIPHLQTWLGIAGALAEGFFGMIMAMAPQGQELATAIGDIARDLAEWANSAQGREEIKAFLRDAIPNAVRFVKAVFKIVTFLGKLVPVANGVGSAMDFLWQALLPVRLIIRGIVWVIQKLAGLAGTLSVKLENFANKIPGMFSSVFETVKGVWEDIKGLFSGLWNTFYDFGKNIINGLKDGVLAVAQDLFNAIKDTVMAPVDWVKGKLHIGSPSKLMMEMGHNVGRGFEIGIQRAGGRVMTAAAGSLVAPVAAAGAAGAGAGAGFIIQNQNVNLPPAPGHGQMGDPRHQAAQFAAELRRRGGQGLGGGGVR